MLALHIYYVIGMLVLGDPDTGLKDRNGWGGAVRPMCSEVVWKVPPLAPCPCEMIAFKMNLQTIFPLLPCLPPPQMLGILQ